MTGNALKLIACISMLIDHAGYLLFPQYELLRYIGRLAMPIFAFFVSEGCRYTSNRLRYFLRMLLLGAACQAVYTAEELLSGGIRSVHLNILFTFSLSMIICFAYLDLEKVLKSADKSRLFEKAAAVALCIFGVLAFDAFCTESRALVGISISFDYGFFGAILPLFALLGTGGTHQRRMAVFSIGFVLFVLNLRQSMHYAWFALFDIPLLYFYNGKRGRLNTKYLFYIFYPAHLAALYLISLVWK